MSEHRFTVGQTVQFTPEMNDRRTAGGRYTIVRLLPEEGRVPQYRIRSAVDGRERLVLESLLERGRGG